MDSEKETTQDRELELLCEYYAGLERQGPGSPETTAKALGFIDPLPADAKIADIGCGTGGQTMSLAKHLDGHITGIDLFPEFIEIFNQSFQDAGLQDRVTGAVASMEQLPFQPQELDLIWAEGAIYNMGFQRGLEEWRRFLKPGGWLAVTEISWLTSERPAELHDFWTAEYPEIDSVPAKLAQLQAAGFVPRAAFVIPPECWTDHFFAPQVAVQDAFLERHPDDPVAAGLVAAQQREADLYARFGEFFGYAFYVGRKLGRLA